MQRNFLRGLLICLLPCALFGAFAAVKPYRKGIDLAGGTILIYQVDLEKAKKRKDLERKQDAVDEEYSDTGLSHERMAQLAESLKRRIDPADLKNVIIRPVGNSRIEIILPFTPGQSAADGTAKEGANEDFVQFVKNVVSQVGVLEFRMLANDTDDAEAMAEAERLVNGLSAEEADKLAKAGEAPPAPREKYTVKINDDEAQNVEYQWVELSKEERESLRLNNASAGVPGMNDLWGRLAANRGKAYRHSSGGDGKSGSMMLFSREFIKEKPTKEEEAKKVEYFILTRLSDVDAVKVEGDVTLTAFPEQDPNLNLAVGFSFNGAGSQKFSRMTGRNKPSGQTVRHLAVVLDDKVVSAPTLNSQLTGRAIIQGPPGKGLEQGYVDRLVYILKSGALTAALNPTPVSENTVGATLGQDTIRKGLFSVALSFLTVMAFMVVYYRFAGVVACIALLANLLLTVGFMVGVNAAFTLAGLAGIVLMLGMAVDANVLIYERLREERARGATIAAAIRNGYDRALPTIIDTHLSSIFTAIVLYTFGNDNLKGFSISLTVGLIISLFTSLYMTRLMFDYWLSRRWITELKMMQLFPRPNINFMGIRRQMFTLTAISSVVGLALFLYRGEKGLNVDFRGGTMYGGRLENPLPLSGGKGLLDLVGEDRQREKLKVKDVYQAASADAERPAASSTALERTYYIEYEGAPRTTVTLSNKPEGDTWEAQKADLIRRASGLPDVSVEQVYISTQGDDSTSGESKSFTLKTTEKEPALVQVILDRLLRNEAGNPLLTTTTVTVPAVDGPSAVLAFDKPTSTAYVKELLTREFNLANSTPKTGAAFTVTGDPAAEKDGKFTRMAVSVADNNVFVSLRDAASAGALAGGPGAVAGRSAQDKADFQTILDKFKGAFESRPVPEQLQTFDATLAADTRAKAMYAILASWAAILMYLWFRFGSWTFGAAAVVCLIHDLCFTLGAIAVCHYLHVLPVFGSTIGFQLRDFKIDLVTVAALLTLVGYSVNDTIVVFDRIREVRGKNPLLTPQMINDSVNQTLSRTVLAALTVFLVVVVLYFFGGEGVHLFSFVMVMGVLVGTYSSIYIASPLLLMFGEGTPVVRPGSAVAKEPARV